MAVGVEQYRTKIFKRISLLRLARPAMVVHPVLHPLLQEESQESRQTLSCKPRLQTTSGSSWDLPNRLNKVTLFLLVPRLGTPCLDLCLLGEVCRGGLVMSLLTVRDLRLPSLQVPKMASSLSLKIRTWFDQFDQYCTVCGISPDRMTSYAVLCLQGKAAEHWQAMKRAAEVGGRDLTDSPIFKAAMLEHYVDLATESTLRPRLAKLVQRGTVGEYHAGSGPP